VLVVHILSASAWFGMDIVLGIVVFTAIFSDSAATKSLCYRALELFAIWPLFYRSTKFGWAVPLLGSFEIADPDHRADAYWAALPAYLGTGRFDVISTENPSVLAYVRTLLPPSEDEDEEVGEEEPQPTDLVLCVCNLSRFAQPAELPLQRFDGKTPIELLGRVPFPKIGELPYFVTLAPYGFYWFQLVDQ